MHDHCGDVSVSVNAGGSNARAEHQTAPCRGGRCELPARRLLPLSGTRLRATLLPALPAVDQGVHGPYPCVGCLSVRMSYLCLPSVLTQQH